MNRERWDMLMHALGFPPNEDTWRTLCAAYSEKHRHYHTREHVQACLALLDRFATLGERPHEIALALWFHDAVYRPLSKHNERDSAEWAAQFLAANAAPASTVARVRCLIMATAHEAPAMSKDESLLVDIDLAILGADSEAYAAYEAAIRREYRLVPEPIYRRKRADLLTAFLQRPRIYQNKALYSEREQQARANLSAALSKLSGNV